MLIQRSAQLHIESGNANIYAEYEHPLFELFDPAGVAGRLPKLFLARLAAFGVSLNTIKWDSADTIGGVALSAPAVDYRVSVRIGIERVAVECYRLSEKLPVSVVTRVGAEAISTILDALGENPIARYTADIAIHGRPAIDVMKLLDSLVNLPSTSLPGTLQGRGATYYYGEAGDQLSSAVNIERSKSVEGGVFFRRIVTWKADKLPVDGLPDLIENDLANTLVAFGLQEASPNAR